VAAANIQPTSALHYGSTPSYNKNNILQVCSLRQNNQLLQKNPENVLICFRHIDTGVLTTFLKY